MPLTTTRAPRPIAHHSYRVRRGRQDRAKHDGFFDRSASRDPEDVPSAPEHTRRSHRRGRCRGGACQVHVHIAIDAPGTGSATGSPGPPPRSPYPSIIAGGHDLAPPDLASRYSGQGRRGSRCPLSICVWNSPTEVASVRIETQPGGASSGSGIFLQLELSNFGHQQCSQYLSSLSISACEFRPTVNFDWTPNLPSRAGVTSVPLALERAHPAVVQRTLRDRTLAGHERMWSRATRPL